MLQTVLRFIKAVLPILRDNRGQLGDKVDPDQMPDGLTVDDDGEVIETPQDEGETSQEGDGEPEAEVEEPEHDDEVEPEPEVQEPDEMEQLRAENLELSRKIGELTSKPTTKEKPEPEPTEPTTVWDKSRALKVEYTDTNHPFHGKTLGEIYDINPEEAFAINAYHAIQIENGKREEQRRAQEADQRAERDQSERMSRELNEFHNEFSSAKYSTAFDTLTPDQQKDVRAMSEQVTEWMVENQKYGITVSDAYYLMDRAGQVTSAMKQVIRDATTRNATSISSKRDTTVDDTEDNMAKWTEDQMMTYIDDLSPSAYDKFLSTADKKVRSAFPGLPWN